MSDVLKKFVRAADYLSAAQIYLQDNVLLTEPLTADHIKPRLLGHWGTCPGINFTYAHLNRAIIAHDVEMMFVLGPGHGFPAVQANLFLEGTLSKYFPKVTHNTPGIAHMARQFSWPYGSPSHSNPEAPGVILEGGELGYALSTSYGAILDNPNLVVACLVGDGEAETGPTATAWHLNKLIDPATNGAVLPILHLNGYKISGPTFFGRMSDDELRSLFYGYGYEPHFVDAYTEEDVHAKMMEVMDTAIEAIRFTQHCAREGTLHETPRFPMIVLRTPKGWNSIDYIGDKKIEDNHYSHQVIADGAKKDPAQLAQLEEWLRSYNFNELFDGEKFDDDIQSLIPREGRKMGDTPHARGGDPTYKPLELPNVEDYDLENTCNLDDPICGTESGMEKVGKYLRDAMKANEANRNLRLMSPDETYSNKLDATFEVTNRAFVWPHKEWDRNLAWDGRVLEMLSEHSLQGMLQGYVLTGRHGVFASYEAFVQIVASMADQYAKFLKIARDVKWRGDFPSFNYILTSGAWRQEHNGFSHQNPGFIDGILQRQGCYTNVYFPADANTALVAFDRMMGSKKEINVLVCSKRPLPVWRTIDEAKKDVMDGVSIWDFASDVDPHIVFSAAGDYPTLEALAAMSLVRKHVPSMRMRFVNITSLSALGIGNSQCRVLRHDFKYYFTEDKPVIINFHGYPQTIKQILFDYAQHPERFTIHGYEESGSTTTPFDMMVRNRVDRFHLAMDAFAQAAEHGLITQKEAHDLIADFQEELEKNREYAIEHGEDREEITNWVWEKR
ncbi:phosphoketolase family protein [Candidatus Kaiserbacteria bacterium]|nr:phosphoketolase family protein [Candidatus Kaiserbacteria bacterium]MCB9818331.1 phosphoketolase family protein [Candidatus Nomurabacteria bacterium]